jgi:DNA-binding transcriptional regulator LsrR (DeoR family)
VRKHKLPIKNIQLPEPYYTAYRHYYIEKLTQKQIALKMEISLYRVQGYLSKARFLIRKSEGVGSYFKPPKQKRSH